MITCVLKNHQFRNEVQTIAQVFYPNEKFAFEQMPAPQGITAMSEVCENGAEGTVFEDGRQTAAFKYSPTPQPYLNPRRHVMLALYFALKQVNDTPTPWGSLTGIRPSKPVREWLDNGCDDNEILQRLISVFDVSAPKARLALEVAKAERQLQARIFTQENPVSIYIGIPFCPSRCIYCSFNASRKPPNEETLERYTNALITEINQKKDASKNITSIYIGGGTPTILPPHLLEKLLHATAQAFGEKSPEFTVEAGRPDTLNPTNLQLLKQYNTTRLAINPQTLNNDTLRKIGRDHTAEDFINAFELARKAGFKTINTDIIIGLPDETVSDIHNNFKTLLALSPENITIHTLAVKRASAFNEEKAYLNAQPQAIPEMLSTAAEYCAKAGYAPYYLYRQKNMLALHENVGYSKPTHECLYNIGMMSEVQTVIGIGAGAVTKHVQDGVITREFNPKDPEIYIKGAIT